MTRWARRIEPAFNRSVTPRQRCGKKPQPSGLLTSLIAVEVEAVALSHAV